MYSLLLFIGVISVLLSLAGTYCALKLLPQIGLVDKPKKRGNHKKTTPRGGGIAIVDTLIIVLPFIAYVFTDMLPMMVPFIGALLAIALLSFVDDLKSLSATFRLLLQLLIISISLPYIKGDALLLHGLLPIGLDNIITIMLWLWFVNLYNFMDGIDGITAVETLSICLGIILVVIISIMPPSTAYYAMAVFGATAGFVYFNWPPAKLFLGDVGSISLGFLVGWLLIDLALNGHPIPALILPMYYLADSGITLGKRFLKGKNIFAAHSDHYYQTAIRKFKHTHKEVSIAVIITNVALILLAIWASISSLPIIPLIFAAGVTTVLLLWCSNKELFPESLRKKL